MYPPPLAAAVRIASCIARAAWRGGWTALAAWLTAVGASFQAGASLADYDAAIAGDAAAGLVPVSRRTSAVTLNGVDRVPWNFGTVSGDATFEFIVNGDPASQSAYLAVGANASSNLRFAQWPGTGQLGFTQLGVRDYSFTPAVPTPVEPTHVVYAWTSATRTLRLYRNGVLAGTSAGVDPAFAMPTGAGWLGSNPSGGEAMTGTLHRLTVYDEPLPESTIRAHAQAFDGVFPAPVLHEFSADRVFFAPGDAVRLDWRVEGALGIRIDPVPGDVGAFTREGRGTVTLRPAASLRLVLEATNRSGRVQAALGLRQVAPAPHPVISEFVADDRSTLADEDGEHSGWIEIFNPTAAPVSLEGCTLTDDALNPGRWRFPPISVAPGAFVVVFASGKDRTVPGRPLHANFRLGNAGEYLALTGPGGAWQHAFAPAYPAQTTDVAYGLHGGDPGTAGFLSAPTPGQPNPDRPVPPVGVGIAPGSGTFTNTLVVELSHPDPDAEILFTLDGTEPGRSNGTRYTGPVSITRSTHVRAVALAQGLAGPVAGQSYLRIAPNLAGYSSPLPLLVIENFGAGPIRQKGWNTTGAGLRQVPRQPATWATFDRASGTGTATFAQVPQMLSRVGIRGRGAYSSEWRQKPYSVEAMDEAGGERDVSPLGLPAHADWILYYPDADPSRDPTLLFNTFAYDLSRSFGGYSVRFRWVEAFVNEDGGDLRLEDRRGIYAIVERVARGGERLDFQRLSPDGASGGWLLNINRMDPEPETGWPAPNGTTRPSFFHTAGANRVLQTQPDTAYASVPGDDQPQQPNAFINFDNPNGYVITPVQRAAIEQWFRRFEDVLYDDALWRDPARGYRQFLDVPDFIDYFILNTLTRNGDGLLISMFPWKGDDGRLRMGPAWDYNWASYHVSGGPTGSLLHRSDRLWYARLFADPDFAQAHIDRWWALRAGPLAAEAMDGLVDRQAAEITPEKALLNGMPGTAEWTRRLGQMKTWLRQRADWIDRQYIAPPTINVPGGEVPDGFGVVLAAASGTLYVTTDGTDPRAPGGAISPSARVYTGPLVLHGPTRLLARSRAGTVWSGLRAAIFTLPQDLATLVLSEIMYHPAPSGTWSGEDLEFLELKNAGTRPLELGGLSLTNAVTFAFTPGTRLEPGAFLVLARRPEALRERHPGLSIHGTFEGQLNNAGELLRLVDTQGRAVLALTYDDTPPWPAAADGSGRSLVPREDSGAGSSADPAYWRASTEPGGSPGADDPPVIVLHPLPQEAVPGQPVTFSVAVHPSASLPLRVRWQRNGVDLAGSDPTVNDRHLTFLSLPHAQPPSTEFRAVVANAEHPDGVTSRAASLVFLADTDADGLPDAWETAHGLDPVDPRDAGLDPDSDGATHQAEFIAGTDPAEARSVLGLDVARSGTGTDLQLRFHALPLRSYALEACDELPPRRWIRVAEFAAESTARIQTLPVGATPNGRYFRLVTPRPPP